MHKFFIVGALSFLSTIVLCAGGCDESIEFSNTPPGSLSITRDLCYLAVGQTVGLIGEASDADGDSISYSWTAPSGTLSPADGKGPEVSWTAPNEPGVYRIMLRVTDGIDKSSKGIDIEVGPKFPPGLDLFILDRTDVPYFIDGVTPLRIAALVTLRVSAGVTIIVNNPTSGLLIQGTMIVEGTESDRVVIKPNVCPGEEGSWRGILFEGPDAVGDLSCMNLRMAQTAIDASDGATVSCTGVIVEGSAGAAVSVVDSARVDMNGCKIWDNGAGVYVENGIIDFVDSSIRDNAVYGFYLISSGYAHPFSATVTACVVATNDGDGFVLSQYADPAINGNSIFLNETINGIGYALKLTAYSGTRTIDATGNYWGVDMSVPENVNDQIFRGPAAAVVDYSGWLADPPVSD